MVESYSKNANHNMRRPVVKDEIVDFMRTRQKPVAGALKELEAFARKENIPIIPHETVAYFRLLLQALQPKKILEIGTAIDVYKRQLNWWSVGFCRCFVHTYLEKDSYEKIPKFLCSLYVAL